VSSANRPILRPRARSVDCTQGGGNFGLRPTDICGFSKLNNCSVATTLQLPLLLLGKALHLAFVGMAKHSSVRLLCLCGCDLAGWHRGCQK
jgi:hypothetical protein